MKKTKIVTLLSLILVGIVSVLILTSCGGASEKSSDGKTANSEQTVTSEKSGERTDGKPGRYTYNISYTFTLPDGKEINGFTKKIGDSVYLKADGTSTVRVRYFSTFPYINAMERDTGLDSKPQIFVKLGYGKRAASYVFDEAFDDNAGDFSVSCDYHSDRNRRHDRGAGSRQSD